MKTKYFIMAAFILTVGLGGCSKEDSSNPATPQGVSDNLKVGTWRITYFWDSDHEETNHFTGYSFTFSDNGVHAAANGKAIVSGTWSTMNDDSQSKLVIFFADPPDFTDLNDDWTTLESTDKKIRLEDVSGGGGGTDYLTFEKN